MMWESRSVSISALIPHSIGACANIQELAYPPAKKG